MPRGPPGLIDGKAPGNRPLLNAEQREALKQIVEAGPKPAVDGVVRWRLVDLAQWVSCGVRHFGQCPDTEPDPCVAWATASSPPAPAIMPRILPPLRLLKKLPRACGRGCASRCCRQAYRSVV